MLGWILIPKKGNTSAQERAFILNHTLYLLSTPANPDPNGTVNPIVNHPDGRDSEVMMRIKTDFIMPILTDDDAQWAVIDDWLRDSLTPGQANNIINYLKGQLNNAVTFGDLLPAGITVYDKADLIADGWLLPDEE